MNELHYDYIKNVITTKYYYSLILIVRSVKLKPEMLMNFSKNREVCDFSNYWANSLAINQNIMMTQTH